MTEHFCLYCEFMRITIWCGWHYCTKHQEHGADKPVSPYSTCSQFQAASKKLEAKP